MTATRTLVLALGLVSTVAALPASAASQAPVDTSATPGIDRRMDNQARRIDAGVESGRLTPREAQRLERRQDRIQGDANHARADGVVDRSERRELHRELNRTSRATARQGHDLQNDFDRDGRVDRLRK